MATEQVTPETETEATSALDRVISVAQDIRATPPAFVGLVIFSFVAVITIIGPYIIPYDPTAIHPAHVNEAPNAKFLLGTDPLGRDLLSRVIVGGQTSLALGLSAVGLSLAAGVPIGLTSGYYRGRIDEILMRTMDIMMSIPGLLLGLLILTALPPNLLNVIIAIGIVYTPRIARVVRSATLEESTKEYVEAARAQNEDESYILFGEIMPNVVGPILVEGSVRIGFAIILGASLSFLGLGTQPPAADWGYMINQARRHMTTNPYYLLWPSVALIVTVFSVNMLGDGLRDVFDTKGQGEEV